MQRQLGNLFSQHFGSSAATVISTALDRRLPAPWGGAEQDRAQRTGFPTGRNGRDWWICHRYRCRGDRGRGKRGGHGRGRA